MKVKHLFADNEQADRCGLGNSSRKGWLVLADRRVDMRFVQSSLLNNERGIRGRLDYACLAVGGPLAVE